MWGGEELGRQSSSSSERRLQSSELKNRGFWIPLLWWCSLKRELSSCACPGTGLLSLEEPLCGHLSPLEDRWWQEGEMSVIHSISSLEQPRAGGVVRLCSFSKETISILSCHFLETHKLDTEKTQKGRFFFSTLLLHKTWPWLIQPWRCIFMVHLSAAEWIKSLGQVREFEKCFLSSEPTVVFPRVDEESPLILCFTLNTSSGAWGVA